MAGTISKGTIVKSGSNNGGGGGGSTKGILFENIKEVSAGTVALDKNSSIYKVTPTANFSFDIDLTGLNIPANTAVTFYLLVDMTGGTYDITWANSIQWGNTSPTMTAMVKYLFAFTTFDGGTSWVGNQMYSWL